MAHNNLARVTDEVVVVDLVQMGMDEPDSVVLVGPHSVARKRIAVTVIPESDSTSGVIRCDIASQRIPAAETGKDDSTSPVVMRSVVCQDVVAGMVIDEDSPAAVRDCVAAQVVTVTVEEIDSTHRAARYLVVSQVVVAGIADVDPRAKFLDHQILDSDTCSSIQADPAACARRRPR